MRQRKRLQAPLDSAAMLDKAPIRTPLGAQLIACPPKHQARPADPCALVIFGATGDLTKRLVVPALYNLSRSKVLPELDSARALNSQILRTLHEDQIFRIDHFLGKSSWRASAASNGRGPRMSRRTRYALPRTACCCASSSVPRP